MHAATKFAVLALLALSLTGCLEYTEKIVIGRDGSATIQVELKVAKAIHSLVAQNPAFKSLAMLMNGDELAKNLPQGLTLEEHREIPTGGRTIYGNKLFAPDAQALNTKSSLFDSQSFSVDTLPDGSLRYKRSINFTAASKDPEFEAMIRENRMGIVGILKSAPFSFRFETPLKVLSTNGAADAGGVVWNYSLYELLYNKVEQEVVMAPPSPADKLIGAGRMLFRPAVFPVFALALLGLFFLATRRPRSA
jgi:hypothetical protein